MHVRVLPNIWRLRRGRGTKFDMNVSNEKLLNANVKTFTVSELLRENQQPVERVKLTPTPRLESNH